MFKFAQGTFIAIATCLMLFMVSNYYKELDNIHRFYIVVALMGAAVPAFIMAYMDGYRESQKLNLADRIREAKEACSPEAKAKQADHDEYMAVQAALDHHGVPREDNEGNQLTLWGRLHFYTPQPQEPVHVG